MALLFCVCLYLGFRSGVRLGMQAVRGVIPPKVDPVGAAKAAVAGDAVKPPIN